MNKRSSILFYLFFGSILIIGIGIILYPSFSTWWNSRVQSQAISNYDKAVGDLGNEEKQKIFERAEKYNRKLAELPSPLSDYANVSGYENVLDITGTGIMGYITIPKINVYLPIYHGTSPEVLNIAVGHLQGSTLPIGGTSRHSVISAHRGLPSSKLFTDIDQLVEDDTFTITILDEIYTYSVDNIEVVLPTELNSLNIIPDQDNVTLMTCTPYGINTHRLLVRSHRIDTYKPHEIRVPADAVPIDKMNCIPFIVAAVVILLILFWVIQGRMTRRFGLAEQFENGQHIPHNNKKG